jgi:Sap, sulfolipid-1-addressing protein
MMAGPQIMSAIIFVTSEKAVKNSLAFVIGVLVATAVGVAALRGLQSLVGGAVDFCDSSDNGSTGKIIQFALVALLVAFAIKNFVGRETIEPPKWLGKLQQADPKQALRTGLLVIFFMPSDIIVMLTVATNLEQNGDSVGDAVPFILLTTLIAALPLLGYLLFHRRAVVEGVGERGVSNGEGSRFERQGRQAIRGPAQEGDEQEPRCGHRQHAGRLEQGREAVRQRRREQPQQQEQRKRERRQPRAEAEGRPQGRQGLELSTSDCSTGPSSSSHRRCWSWPGERVQRRRRVGRLGREHVR